MKVYGIGLPRTGTKALAQGLRVLGFCGSNTCILTNHKQKDKIIFDNNNIFDVNNGAFDYYQILFKFNPNAKFIFTTRNLESWLISV